MNRRSLTFRLVAWYCALLFLLGVGFAAYTYTDFDRYVRTSTKATLVARADTIRDIAGTALDDRAALAPLIEQRFAPELRARFIRVIVNGQVAYMSGPPTEHEFDPSIIPLPTTVKTPRLERFSRLIVYVRSYKLADGRVLTVETGEATGMMRAVEKGLAVAMLFGLPVLLILAAGGGYVLVRRALTPVESMIKAAEALTFNSPHNRLPPTGTGDRIEALGQALNRMLERLDNAYQHASRFSADAAHEIGTPLSIMRGEMELLATRRDLPPDVLAALGSTLDEAVRLSQIVENLMALSRLESIAGKRTHKAVDLTALADETIDQMRLLAEDKNIRLDGPSGRSVVVLGDRNRLKQVLVNLFDNAVKYTPSGGRVSVAVEAAGTNAVLTVADTGIGIAPEHQQLIFDRFFRVAADRGESGAGLGLAIVKSICVAHGGRVSVNSTPGQGSRFCVELPLASAADLGEGRAAPPATPPCAPRMIDRLVPAGRII